jgi:hypothetical protein
MTTREIIKKDSILKIKKTMEDLRGKNQQISKEVSVIMEESTRKEKEELETAVKKYNEKVNKVLESKQIKEKLEKRQGYEDRIYELMDRVKTSFRKAVKEINKQPISNKEKQERIKQLAESLEDAVLSNNERELMKIIKSQLGNLPYQSVKLLC